MSSSYHITWNKKDSSKQVESIIYTLKKCSVWAFFALLEKISQKDAAYGKKNVDI